MQPQTLQAGSPCSLDRTGQDLVIHAMRLHHQRRLRARNVQIGQRQRVTPRQVLHERVHECAYAPGVHRTVVDRDQFVTTHQAEPPSSDLGPPGRERDTIAIAEPLGCPRPAERFQAVRPAPQRTREVVLLLCHAGRLVHAPVTTAVARRLAARRQFLV